MGSMVIFHCSTRSLKEEDVVKLVMPTLMEAQERKDFFNQLMLSGVYQPAYVIQSDDLSIAFDCGNGYPPEDVECLELPNTAHTSTSVGDIIVVNGTKRMLVMPLGFEEL